MSTHVDTSTPPTAEWIWHAALAADLVLWIAIYRQLLPFANWLVSLTPLDPTSHSGEALAFFLYDVPKVLMLLVLIVFAMDVVRSFFSPEKTRALLSGKAEGVGNAMAASLGIVAGWVIGRLELENGSRAGCATSTPAPICLRCRRRT